MERKEFIKILSKYFVEQNFINEKQIWYIEREEIIIAIDIQQSQYSKLFYVNIRVYIKDFYIKNLYTSQQLMEAIKKRHGMFLTTITNNTFFNLDYILDDEIRESKIINHLNTFLIPIIKLAGTRSGVKKLITKNILPSLPAIIEVL